MDVDRNENFGCEYGCDTKREETKAKPTHPHTQTDAHTRQRQAGRHGKGEDRRQKEGTARRGAARQKGRKTGTQEHKQKEGGAHTHTQPTQRRDGN